MSRMDHFLAFLAKTVDRVVFGFSDYNEQDIKAQPNLDEHKEKCEI